MPGASPSNCKKQKSLQGNVQCPRLKPAVMGSLKMVHQMQILSCATGKGISLSQGHPFLPVKVKLLPSLILMNTYFNL